MTHKNVGRGDGRWRAHAARLTAGDVARLEGYGHAWDPKQDGALAALVANVSAEDVALYHRGVRGFAKLLRERPRDEAPQLAAFLRAPLGEGLRVPPRRRYAWLMRPEPVPSAVRVLPPVWHPQSCNKGPTQPRVWSLVPLETANASGALIDF